MFLSNEEKYQDESARLLWFEIKSGTVSNKNVIKKKVHTFLALLYKLQSREHKTGNQCNTFSFSSLILPSR